METSADALAERLAHLIARWRLVTPAIAFLEANKPLSFVGSQALLMLQPMLDLFVTREWTTDLVTLLADREQLETLITRLETAQSQTDEFIYRRERKVR
jgi:hypothetical protein